MIPLHSSFLLNHVFFFYVYHAKGNKKKEENELRIEISDDFNYLIITQNLLFYWKKKKFGGQNENR